MDAATDKDAGQDEMREALRYLFDPLLCRAHTRPAYRELPHREEMKVGRVAAIYDRGQLLPHLARFISERGHGLGRFEKGCYIIVPPDFPNECDVHVTDQGVHAVAKVGGQYRTFIARPAATVEAAWDNYDLQRGWTQTYPEDIGRVYDPSLPVPLAEPADEETAALISEYAQAEARPGFTVTPRPAFAAHFGPGGPGGFSGEPIPDRVFTPPHALAVYRHPDVKDPLHLGAMMAFAVRLCAGRRAYVGIFLPEGAEEMIPALLALAKELNPDARTSDAEKVFDGGYHVTLGVMTEESAHDYDGGHDHITLVTRAGRDALLASGRPGLGLLFSAVVAAPGSFADDAEARDQLLKHFDGAHLALVWTDALSHPDAPAADYRLTGAIVTYDARHLGAAPGTVERALAHPWVAARIEQAALALAAGEAALEPLRTNLTYFLRAAARSAARTSLDRRRPADRREVAALFDGEGHKAWVRDEVEPLVRAEYALEGELGAHPSDLESTRWQLAHLAYFLVTLARLHPGELPAGEGLANGPWLDLAEQVLLSEGGAGGRVKRSPLSTRERDAAGPLATSRPGDLQVRGACGCGLRMITDTRPDASGAEHPYFYFEREGATPEGWSDTCPRCGLDHYARHRDRAAAPTA